MEERIACCPTCQSALTTPEEQGDIEEWWCARCQRWTSFPHWRKASDLYPARDDNYRKMVLIQNRMKLEYLFNQ